MPNMLTQRRIHTPVTPRSVTGLALWLDAADESTVTLDGSNNVSEWRDKSGFGRHVSQSNSSLRMSYVLNAYRGLATVRQPGSAQHLQAAFTSIPQPITVLFSFTITEGVNSARVFYDSFAVSSLAAYTTGTTTLNIESGTTMIGGTVVLNKPSTLALTHNGANSEIRLSGFRTAIGNSGTNSLTDGIVIGNSRNRLSNRGMTGDMNEFCLYTRILEPGEIATIERYFESKWGTS